MACPKKKTSHRKQAQRRAKWFAFKPQVSICSNCGEPNISHIACTSCGYYNGREYLRALPRKKRKA
ncbi:MAG: 50S ribosomal protein L32 [Candidatus Melainabacteria bacterium]|nr:50S ribosomal protein L32 [Candidatus Melainabacteria bacterium]